MNQFSIIPMLSASHSENRSTSRFSGYTSFALTGILVLTLSACQSPYQMNQNRLCGMTPGASCGMMKPDLRMNSRIWGKNARQCVCSTSTTQSVSLPAGLNNTSCRFSHPAGVTPSITPNGVQATSSLPSNTKNPQNSTFNNSLDDPEIPVSVLIESKNQLPSSQDAVSESLKEDLESEQEVNVKAQPKVQVEVLSETKPEAGMKAEAKAETEAEAIPELERMPLEEKVSENPVQLQRVNAPENGNSLEDLQSIPDTVSTLPETIPSEPENRKENLPNEEESLPQGTLQELEEVLKDSQTSLLPAGAAKSTSSLQFKKVIQKRQPLKRALNPNITLNEHKTGFPVQPKENQAGNQNFNLVQNENVLKSISVNEIRKAVETEKHQDVAVRSASWEAVDKKESLIKLTAAEEPITTPTGKAISRESVLVQESGRTRNVVERPSNAQPADEYIVDTKKTGHKKDVKEAQKGMVSGVEVEGNWEAETHNETGTFIYYNGIEGRATIQSSDPVYIYAPRFRAVRQVIDLNVDEQVTMTGDLYTPTQVSTANRSLETSTTRQNAQVGTGTTRTVMLETQANTGSGILDGNIAVQVKTQEAVIPQENRKINGPNVMNGKTRSVTADGLIEIKAWTQTENLRVFIDKQSASASIQSVAAPSLYTVQEGEKKQDVKIYKVASTNSAKPGETVDFIIYFENTGNSPVGNIVLVDNLPARLEIVEDSAESSVDSSFTYEVNGNGSQTLRWEVTQPLHVGEKGAVKFKALVR